jgi:SLT domain-containing protein
MLEGEGFPALAAGGIVRKPTFALIGESGPEAVVPLGNGEEFGGSQTIITKVYLDRREIAEAVAEELPGVVRRHVR